MADGGTGTGPIDTKKEEESKWIKPGRIALGLGALYAGKRLGDRANYGTENAPPTGYQGDIPDYSLVREGVLDTYNPDRIAGSRGQRYFSDFAFLPRAYAEGTETGGVTVSRNPEIDAVRQAMFEQANVGPDSLRAANYARAGGTAPELPEGAGPTGIDSVLGYPAERLGEYTQEGASAEDFDVTDPTQYQAFAGGNIYVPDYGIVNVYDETSVTNFLFWKETGAGAPGTGGGEEDPGEAETSYDARINQLIEGGMSREQAEAHNQSAVDQGGDLNDDGYVTDEEWARFTAAEGSSAKPVGEGDPGMGFLDPNNPGYLAQGGLVSLMGGGYLSGATDGMADRLNTTIDDAQPAALSDGEFVVPADVVSHLGNGNSDAGANELYTMLDQIRMDRTGTTEQGRQINPNQYMPRGIA
jgi:hypothetical protein